MLRRLGSIAAVFVLHLAILAALLHAVMVEPLDRRRRMERETIVPLMLPQRGQTSRASHKGAEQRGIAAFPNLTAGPFALPSPQAESLGKTLFGCRPENLARLSGQEQEKCERLNGFGYKAFADAPLKIPPHVDKLSNADIDTRIRNTVDLCMAAKATGTECIDTIIFGKRLP